MALATLASAILEGLVELPARFIQLNGGLTIICAVVFIVWFLRLRARAFGKD